MPSPRTTALTLVLLVGVGATVAYYNPHLFILGTGAVPATRTLLDSCSGEPGSVTVIADGTGFNRSSSHGSLSSPWPIIRIAQGQTVTLVVCNQDPSQAHGFVIDHYFIGGVAMNPGNAYKISFVATDPGQFRIYCYIFCSIHKFMLGQLDVVG